MDELSRLFRAIGFSNLGGSNAKVFGIPVFGRGKSARFHRQIMALYDVANGAEDRYYYLIRRFIQRAHLLRLPIAGQWCDADERMFLACFETLGQFVERELGTTTWSGGNLYRGYRLHSCGGTDEKAIDLWLWYKHDLPALVEDYNRDIMEVYANGPECGVTKEGIRTISIKKTRALKYEHDYPETVKEEKLRELIELRRTLWT